MTLTYHRFTSSPSQNFLLQLSKRRAYFTPICPAPQKSALLTPICIYWRKSIYKTNIFFKQIVVIEGSNRLGGWIQSERLQDGTVFEGGPRSFRFGGKVEAKTLELVSNTQ